MEFTAAVPEAAAVVPEAVAAGVPVLKVPDGLAHPATAKTVPAISSEPTCARRRAGRTPSERRIRSKFLSMRPR